jgi:SAM-dependent methyltransferase
MSCNICQSATPKTYVCEEKMFGFKNTFTYAECSFCGSLQIDEIPVNIADYYPPYYYSFTQKIPKLERLPFFKRLFAGIRIRKKYKQDRELFRYLKEIDTSVDDRILDVGCGNGLLICELFNQGFENVEGVDFFLPNEVDHGFNVKVHKKEVDDMPHDKYDLVMMHHVLEHMPEQQETLRSIRKVLKDNGCLMIRIPIIGEAWDTYRENWVQLDAPRHLIIHSVQSLHILAEQTGFEVRKTIYDSTSFQFLGSELYQKGLPLFVKESNYEPYPFDTLFLEKEIQEFENRAKELNMNHRGDSAAFYLYKKN